jgi:hypothetical protein
MRLSKTFIPIGALTLALGVGGSVAQAAQRDAQDRGGHQGHARARSGDQGNGAHEPRGNDERQQRANNEQQRANNQPQPRANNEQQRANNQPQQRGNVERASRDNNWRGQVNGSVDRRGNEGWNRRNDNRGSYAVRGYIAPRSRVEVVRPRFDRHYGPSFSVFFGIGSGYRYGAPYRGRVYGYVPAPVYGARIYYGDVRLQVRPRDAAVFVDGYYAGIVDDFDGVFQRLTLTVGPHEIEIEAPGLEPQVYNVLVDPSRTVDVRADLYPLP